MADATPNPNLSPCVTHQPSLLGGAENIKLLFDEELDSRRETLARARAWEAISLEQAQISNRRAQNAATIDHALNANLVLSAQVGSTEGQQTVSPAGTAASETTKGAVAAAGAGEAVSAETVTANVANLMTALTPVISSAIANAVSTAYQMFVASLPTLITAIGGASTPSQTEPKSAPATA
ncbi:MAG TPA: hypothetical protein VML19_04195 [Verrucomicrobiae bacterium]|nr:hypothetical protein [Verrucomicrobiae bacterium]